MTTSTILNLNNKSIKNNNRKAKWQFKKAINEEEVIVPMLQLKPIPSERLRIPIIGTSSLIVHNWSQKAKRQLLDAQQGRKTPKQIRNPQEDYEASLYRLANDGGFGFPSLGFKGATVSAARFFDKTVRMTDLRQMLFFRGLPSDDGLQLLTKIEAEPRMREDMVRLNGQTADIRFRGEFVEWTAILDVVYITSALDRASLLTLVDAGGMGVGIGEWRPEKKGLSGTYAVDATRDVEVVNR